MQKLAFPVSILLTALLAGCAAAGGSGTASSPQAAPSQPAAQSATASAEATRSPAASAAPSAAPSAPPNTITLSEWKVGLPSTIKAGKITFTINNTGAAEHELIAFRSKLDPLSFPQVKGDVDESGKGIVQVTDGEDISVGGTQARTIDLTTPGSYVFMCNIPGHFHLGMYAVVTVTK